MKMDKFNPSIYMYFGGFCDLYGMDCKQVSEPKYFIL